jgi:hypothetical protein
LGTEERRGKTRGTVEKETREEQRGKADSRPAARLASDQLQPPQICLRCLKALASKLLEPSWRRHVALIRTITQHTQAAGSRQQAAGSRQMCRLTCQALVVVSSMWAASRQPRRSYPTIFIWGEMSGDSTGRNMQKGRRREGGWEMG